MSRFEVLRCDQCGTETEANDSTGWYTVEREENSDAATFTVNHYCSAGCAIEAIAGRESDHPSMTAVAAQRVAAEVLSLWAEGKEEDAIEAMIQGSPSAVDALAVTVSIIRLAVVTLGAVGEAGGSRDAEAFARRIFELVARTVVAKEVEVDSLDDVDWEAIFREEGPPT